jgi:alkylation response protein AidB-like acyl-CoA dehydrogenase
VPELASAADAVLLRESVREALAGLSDSASVREQMATTRGWSPAVWSRLAAELGLAAMLLDPELGGGGFTVAELGVVMEEAGAALLGPPLFATAALAVPLLIALDDAAALERYGPPIAAGDLTATVALAEDDGRWELASVTLTARPDDGGTWLLDGAKNYVIDGAHAGLVLVVARTPDGLGVFAVEADDAVALGREQLVTLDQTRKQARLTFEATPARLVGTGDATAAIDSATATARALLAAEQAGAAGRALDITAEYARTRIQFGRPIGSFQAVKQRLAEMLVQVESARSAAYAATRALALAEPDAARSVAVAAITCSDAFTWVSGQMIQLHGGMGFTWEHDANLFFKRAYGSAELLGSPEMHVRALEYWLEDATDEGN